MFGRLSALLLLSGAGSLAPVSSAMLAGSLPPAAASRPAASPAALQAASAGSVGIRLVPVGGVAPDNPIAGPYIVDRLAPGSVLRRVVELDNISGAPIDISVYPAAASVVEGRFAFAAGRGGNELSTWTRVGRGLVRLAPDSKAYDSVVVAVPRDATEGEDYAVVWAQVSATSATSGVTLVNRVGVRMYLSIGTGGALPSNFTVTSLTAERSAAGSSLVVARVRNTGQTTLHVAGDLSLSGGPSGLRAGPFAATLGAVLAPGISEPVVVKLKTSLPRGPWKADMTLSSGSLRRSDIAMILFPRSPPVVALAGPAKASTAPIVVLVVVLLGLAFLVALALMLRRRTSRHGDEQKAVPSLAAGRGRA